MDSSIGRHRCIRLFLAVIQLILLFFFQLDDFIECVPDDVIVTETEFCQRYVRSEGYVCEEHKMYTGDGFALMLHRVGILVNQPSSLGENDRGSAVTVHSSELKLAVEHRRMAESESPPEPIQKSDDSTHDIATFTYGFPFERPYQLAKTKPGSRSDHRTPSTESSKWLGGDAKDSPENRPLSLPPYSIENPIVVQQGSSNPPVPSAVLPSSEQALISAGSPADQLLTPSLSPVPVSSDFSNGAPFTIDTPGSPRSPVNPIWIPSSPELSPASAFPNLAPGPAPVDQSSLSFGPELAPSSSSYSAQSTSLVIPSIFTPIATPSNAPGFQHGGADPGPTDSTLSSPPSAQTRDSGNLDYTTIRQGPSPASAIPLSQISPGPVPGVSATGDSQGSQDLGGGKGESVLLMHPELLNGDSWFKDVDEDGNSPFLPFVLADRGFDVWVGHERATYWNHDNIQWESSNQGYWDWTWDEHAQLDVPMMLGYINAKMQTKIHYVGVSQSAAVGAAAATRADAGQLMKSLVLVGPTIYRGRAASPLIRTWAGFFAQITNGPDFIPSSGQFNISREFDMQSLSLGGPVSVVSGPDCCISSVVTLFDNGWDGITSYKNLEHFDQGILSNTFQRFDYRSPASNLDAYGQRSPPSYSPADIPTDIPVMVIHGGQDYFSPPEGINEFLTVLQQTPTTLFLPLYAHFDLFFSSSRNEDVYSPISSFLEGVYKTKTAAGTETNAPKAS